MNSDGVLKEVESGVEREEKKTRRKRKREKADTTETEGDGAASVIFIYDHIGLILPEVPRPRRGRHQNDSALFPGKFLGMLFSFFYLR